MAYLKARKNRLGKTYYASQVFYDGGPKPITISLKTSDYEVAMHRHQEIEDKEKAIKQGMTFTWSWEDGENGRTRIVKVCLGILVERWLESKRINVRKSTLERYRISLNAFINVMGKTCHMSAISNKSIEDFKRFYDGKHTKNGIDINLRGIKAFLLWTLEEGYLKKMPKIVQFNIKTPPKYINESNWKILMLADVDDYWKDVWTLYRDLGSRLQEIIMGSIDGGFLIVLDQHTKSKKILEIPITEHQKSIIQSIHKKRDEHLSNGYKIRNFTDRYSKMFRRTCMQEGLDFNFHCLRHTFAIRKYIETRDILMVSKMLFHESLVPTEKYARFNIYRLEQEYPSLVKKEAKKDILDTQKLDTHSTRYDSPPLLI